MFRLTSRSWQATREVLNLSTTSLSKISSYLWVLPGTVLRKLNWASAKSSKTFRVNNSSLREYQAPFQMSTLKELKRNVPWSLSKMTFSKMSYFKVQMTQDQYCIKSLPSSLILINLTPLRFKPPLPITKNNWIRNSIILSKRRKRK